MADNKLLTVKFSEQMLAELHAAAEILGYRTSSAMIHQLATQKIREAKNSVNDREFERTYEEKLVELRERSREKSKIEKVESKKMVIRSVPHIGKIDSGENLSGTTKERKKKAS